MPKVPPSPSAVPTANQVKFPPCHCLNSTSKNDQLRVDRLSGKEGDKVTLDDVLMVADGDKHTLDASALGKAKVTAKIVAQDRNEKIVVFKKKRRQNYRRKAGHKQPMTVLEITDVSAA